MFPEIIFLIVGFVLLIKGADWLIDGASSIAKYLKVSSLLIGLTLVAFGTSLPELTINIFSAFKNADSLGFGNIVGADLANIGLIVGLIVILSPIRISSATIRKELPFAVLAAGVLWALAFGKILDPNAESFISRGDGLILLIFFAIFVYYIIEIALRERGNHRKLVEHTESIIPEMTVKKAVFLVALSIPAIFLGGQLITESALSIADFFGLSEGLVGLTIVSFGTILPELTASLFAVIKRKKDLALGNIVGSVVFNSFFILGVVSLFSPVFIDSRLYLDLLVLLALSFLLLVFASSRRKLEKFEGYILLFIYIAYVLFIIYRG